MALLSKKITKILAAVSEFSEGNLPSPEPTCPVLLLSYLLALSEWFVPVLIRE